MNYRQSRRRDGERHRHHPHAQGARVLGRDRHAGRPGFSDDPEDLKRMADFLASIDPLMPWHMTAFHRTKDDGRLSAERRRRLMRIVDYGKAAGLRYMYRATCRAKWGSGKNPLPPLQAMVIKRHGFLVLENRVGRTASARLASRCRDLGRASGHGDGRVRPLL